MLCRHHGCELELPVYPAYRVLNGDYTVFDSGSIAFSEADLNPFTRVVLQSVWSTPNRAYLVFCSPAVSTCFASAFCQLELALYSFIALAKASVFLPRSF